jgi:hypothetical protein
MSLAASVDLLTPAPSTLPRKASVADLDRIAGKQPISLN